MNFRKEPLGYKLVVELNLRELTIIEELLNFADDNITVEYFDSMTHELGTDLTREELRAVWSFFYNIPKEELT